MVLFLLKSMQRLPVPLCKEASWEDGGGNPASAEKSLCRAGPVLSEIYILVYKTRTVRCAPQDLGKQSA